MANDKISMDEMFRSLAKGELERSAKIILDLIKEEQDPELKRIVAEVGTANLELLFYKSMILEADAKFQEIKREIKRYRQKGKI
jgi:hypothetical protein